MQKPVTRTNLFSEKLLVTNYNTVHFIMNTKS